MNRAERRRQAKDDEKVLRNGNYILDSHGRRRDRRGLRLADLNTNTGILEAIVAHKDTWDRLAILHADNSGAIASQKASELHGRRVQISDVKQFSATRVSYSKPAFVTTLSGSVVFSIKRRDLIISDRDNGLLFRVVKTRIDKDPIEPPFHGYGTASLYADSGKRAKPIVGNGIVANQNLERTRTNMRPVTSIGWRRLVCRFQDSVNFIVFKRYSGATLIGSRLSARYWWCGHRNHHDYWRRRGNERVSWSKKVDQDARNENNSRTFQKFVETDRVGDECFQI